MTRYINADNIIEIREISYNNYLIKYDDLLVTCLDSNIIQALLHGYANYVECKEDYSGKWKAVAVHCIGENE